MFSWCICVTPHPLLSPTIILTFFPLPLSGTSFLHFLVSIVPSRIFSHCFCVFPNSTYFPLVWQEQCNDQILWTFPLTFLKSNTLLYNMVPLVIVSCLSHRLCIYDFAEASFKNGKLWEKYTCMNLKASSYIVRIFRNQWVK